MSAARICLVAAAALGLNACVGRRDIHPPSPPLTNASPVPEPAAIKVAPPVVRTPAPIARSPQPVAPPAAFLTLDLNTLKKQLRETKAIGFFSKIALKSQVDDLLDEFRKYYQGKARIDMMDLRQSYNLLLMKLLSMLQDEDQKLASAIVSSREEIWNFLADPKKFATLEM